MTAAFILTGTFGVVCRHSLYLTELAERGIEILLITQSQFRAEAAARRAEPDHPARMIAEIGFVDGTVAAEGSYNPGVVAHGQRWRERYHLVGVLAVGETLVEPTGLLADALGLPGPGPRATRVCRSKYLQRWYCPEFAPRSVVLPPGHREEVDPDVVGFPAVVKPASRHSSSGVRTVHDPRELRAQLEGYPEAETVLVEQRVRGQEYSVESLIQQGKILFAGVTRKETTDRYADTFVELTHTVPHGEPGAEETLLAANQRMLDTLGFADGVTHAEWRIDPAGKPVLMEVAARTPGGGIAVLYSLATGAAVEPAILRIALGELAAYPPPLRHARQVYLEHEPGTLEDVELDWPGVRPYWIGADGRWPHIAPGSAGQGPVLRAVLVLKQRGTELGPLAVAEDRAVTFLIDAPSAAELDTLESAVRAAIRVRTSRGD